jgi:hypothetical protein
MPRLAKVVLQAVAGVVEVEEGFAGPRRLGGREDEKTGLSVRRLCIRWLRWERVPTPVVRVGEEERFPELAASVGVVRRAEEVGGRMERTLRTSSRLLR